MGILTPDGSAVVPRKASEFVGKALALIPWQFIEDRYISTNGTTLLKEGTLTEYRTPWVNLISYSASDLVGMPVGEIPPGFMPKYLSTDGKTLLRDTTIIIGLDESPAGFLVGAAFGRNLTDKFAIGGQVKYAVDNLGKMDIVTEGNVATGQEASVSGLLLDFGTNYNTGWKSLNLSMTIQNFGTRKGAENGREEFTAPLTFKVGVGADALDFIGFEDAPAGLIIQVEGTDPRDDYEGLNVGGEFRFDMSEGMFAAVRGGYSRMDDGGMSLGAGFGGNIGGVGTAIDYAWTNYGSLLGGVSRFGVSVSF